MNLRRHLLEAATLVLAAVLCALVANSMASRERKLALIGSYPDALKVGSSASLAPPAQPAPPPPLASTADAKAPAKSPIEEKRPRPTTKAATQSTPAPEGSEANLVGRFPPHPDKPFLEVSGDDAAWLFAQGALVLDARRTKDFEAGHIAGARSFPVWESDIDARVTALVGEARDASIPVVLYCSGGDCEDSHMLAVKLFGGGFNNLLVYSGGWPDWQKRGGRSATGPEP